MLLPNCPGQQARGWEGRPWADSGEQGQVIEAAEWPLCYFLTETKDLGWLAFGFPCSLLNRDTGLTKDIVYLRLGLCFSLSINNLGFWFGHWPYWVVQAGVDTGWLLLQISCAALFCRMGVRVHMLWLRARLWSQTVGLQMPIISHVTPGKLLDLPKTLLHPL